MTLIANQTLAQTQAQHHLSVNLASLDRTQPELRQWVVDQMLGGEWVFARDRSLTAIDEFGQWWAGCSLPTRAAYAALDKLEIKAAVGCFLAPMHAAHLRIALDRLRPEQAIVAIIPEHRDLAMLLHCDDLSHAIDAHRLWLVAGPAWDADLRNLFDRLPGLATPTQFIRTPEADPDQLQHMIATAQQIFTEVSQARSVQVQSLRQVQITVTGAKPQLCVVAPSRFRLWNDLGDAMLRAFHVTCGLEIAHFDADDPLCGSPLALVSAIRSCSAILTANTGRSDLPGLVPDSIPWITWITGTRIPPSALAGPDDHLMVSDPRLGQMAIQSGWGKTRIHDAPWPAPPPFQRTSGSRQLAIIADTSRLQTPKDLIEYSSHAILWESIREELLANPMIPSDVLTYLRERMQRAQVCEQGFPAARFIDKLIVPAYQQGLARVLIRAKIPVQLHGAGWDASSDFVPCWMGEIKLREHLHEVAAAAGALVHVWPAGLSHPIDSMGMPVLRRENGGVEGFIRNARRAVEGTLRVPAASNAPLSASLVLEILRSTSAWQSDTIQ